MGTIRQISNEVSESTRNNAIGGKCTTHRSSRYSMSKNIGGESDWFFPVIDIYTGEDIANN